MFIDLQGCFAAPAARYFPNDGKVPKGSPGDAAGANFVRHDGLPPVPHYGGRIPVRSCNSSGAQNLSDFPPLLPAHWGLGKQKFQVPRLHFRAWVCRADGTGAVDGGRPKGLPYPNSEVLLKNRRGGACSSRGPVWDRPLRKERIRSVIRRRGGPRPARAFPWGKVPSETRRMMGTLPVMRVVRSNRRGGPMWPPVSLGFGCL